jgi:hypothetical protein
VLPQLNARLDVGVSRSTTTVTVNMMTMTSTSTNLTFGFGAPLKWKLNEKLALTSGRPYAYGASDDLFFMVLLDGGKLMVITVPVGVLFQIQENVAAGAHTGFRLSSLSPDMGEGISQKAVPLGVEAWLTLAERFDVGLLVDLDGVVDSGVPSVPGVSVSGPGYFDRRTFTVVAQARF